MADFGCDSVCLVDNFVEFVIAKQKSREYARIDARNIGRHGSADNLIRAVLGNSQNRHWFASRPAAADIHFGLPLKPSTWILHRHAYHPYGTHFPGRHQCRLVLNSSLPILFRTVFCRPIYADRQRVSPHPRTFRSIFRCRQNRAMSSWTQCNSTC